MKKLYFSIHCIDLLMVTLIDGQRELFHILSSLIMYGECPGIDDAVMYSQTHCGSWVWAMLAHWRVAMNIKLGDDPSQAHLGECYLCIVVCHYREYCHLGIPGSYHSCWQFFSQLACFIMRKLVGMSACFDIEVQRSNLS